MCICIEIELPCFWVAGLIPAEMNIFKQILRFVSNLKKFHAKRMLRGLSESEYEFGGCGVAGGQFDGAVVGLQDLARKAEADAVALRFCGVERDEYLLLAANGDGGAVVAHTDDSLAVGGEFGGDGYL